MRSSGFERGEHFQPRFQAKPVHRLLGDRGHQAKACAVLSMPCGACPVLRHGVKYGYLAFTTRPAAPVKICRVLSRSGNLEEAAANLFSHLHALDKAGVDVILAEPVPAKGLGRAIMDRLKRAAASKHRRNIP